MIKRLKTSSGVLAGIAALALGGTAIASAASTTPTKASATKASPTNQSATTRDADTIQSGSQTAPDRADTRQTESPTSETSNEAGGESVTNGDGPGGYADPAGNANTQQQGAN